MKKKLTELEWSKVEQLQERSFHGAEISTEEMKLCMKAVKEDPDRYRKQGFLVRENYRNSLRFG